MTTSDPKLAADLERDKKLIEYATREQIYKMGWRRGRVAGYGEGSVIGETLNKELADKVLNVKSGVEAQP